MSEKKSLFAKDDEATRAWAGEADTEVGGGEDVDGQLTVDVYQTDKEIVVKSTVAGVKPEDIDVSINNDMLTVKGERQNTVKVKEDDYFYQECYWGSFSRSIILPVEVEVDKINAEIEDGILTITLPKAKRARNKKIKVKKTTV